MVERAIIHIGFPKTGSTSLQKYLSDHRDSLLQNHDMCYPKACCGPHNQSHQLVKLFNSNSEEKIKFAAKQILHEAGSAETVIFSDERLALSRINISQIQQFLLGLGVNEVHIIGYVREQLDFTQSLWRERINFLLEFTTPFFHFSEINQVKHNSSFPIMIRDLESIGHVELAWYDKQSLNSANIISDFCSRIGIHGPNILIEDANPSIGGNLLLYKIARNRLWNRINLNDGEFPKHRYRKYNELRILARKHEKFRSPFLIPTKAENTFRQKSAYNRFFINKIGPRVRFRTFNAETQIPEFTTLAHDLEMIFDALNVRPGPFLFAAIRESVPFISSIQEPRFFVKVRSSAQKYRADKSLIRAFSKLNSNHSTARDQTNYTDRRT